MALLKPATARLETHMQGALKETETYAASEARQKFADIFDAAYFGKTVVVTKRDRKVAVVSMETLQKLNKLLESEAEKEAISAAKALKEFQAKGGKTMEQIKQELGMD